MRQRLEELRREADERTAGAAGDALAIHPLPDLPRKRTGPFGASAGLHLVVLLSLILASWQSEPRRSPPPDLEVIFQEPRKEAAARVPLVEPKPPRTEPRTQAQPPATAEPRAAERKPVPPPLVPREIPPPTPLPPPKRMGEQVPIPHLPVPGTVPPEEGKTGKPGPPAPERRPNERRVLPGTPGGNRENDLGAGGPGETGTPAAAPATGPGSSVVQGGAMGRIEVPKLGGGGKSEGSGGGGRRRGLSLQVPVDSGAFGDFSFDDKDYDWSDYWSQMYWAIWRAWHNRLYAMLPVFDRWSFQNRMTALKGAVLIRFVIARNGSVASISVIDPSTMAPLDESAESALKEVILPRLPDDFKKDQEGVTGRFSMEIDDLPSWKEYMKYQKFRGIF